MLGEVISVMDEEVPAVDVDEGAQAQVLGTVALLPSQLLVGPSHMKVLHQRMPSIFSYIDMQFMKASHTKVLH